MTATIIINPAGGPAHRRRGRESIDARVRGLIGNLDADTVVRVTEGPGHAHDLSRQAIRDGADLVIAWGGDGTVNEVGAALVYSGVVLGIVPAGSGNGLARDLGIPAQTKAALAVAFGSTERVVDAGELNGRLFFNVAGIGYDAQVAHTFAQSSGRMRGLAAYAVTAVRELLRYPAAHYAITVDEERWCWTWTRCSFRWRTPGSGAAAPRLRPARNPTTDSWMSWWCGTGRDW